MVKSVVLPASWHQEQLKDLCLYPGEYGLNSPAIPLSPDLPLYIRITDIDDDGRYLLQHRATVNYSGKQKLLQKNDLLFARTGATVGKTYLHQDTSYPTAFAGYLIRFVPNTAKIIPYFLFLYCHTAYYWNWIKIFKARSGQPGISADEYGKMLVPCPPIAEQQKIVEVLETWDKAIQLTRELIEQKELQKKGLLQQLVYKQPKTVSYFLRQLFTLGRGRVISKEEIALHPGAYPVYSSQTADNGVLGFINTFDFDGEYITWTTDGANAGKVFYRTGKFNCTNVCGTAQLKQKNQHNLYYIMSYLNNVTKKYVSYVGNPKLMNGVFANILIALPSKELQDKAAALLTTLDKDIDLLRQKLAKLKEQKNGLMQVLLTGKVRLQVGK